VGRRFHDAPRPPFGSSVPCDGTCLSYRRLLNYHRFMYRASPSRQIKAAQAVCLRFDETSRIDPCRDAAWAMTR